MQNSVLTINIGLPFLVCLLGGAVFLLVNEAKNPDAKKMSFAVFWVGLLVTLFVFSHLTF